MKTAIAATAKMYECQEAAKTLFGDKYSAKMAEYGDVIRVVAKRKGWTELKAALSIAHGNSNDGMLVMLAMAAAVELIEPS